jgi:hypothetical protein
MEHMKKLVALYVGLMMILIGSIAVAHDGGGGETKVIKSKESGTFVSANFDFDHPDLSTPAVYINGEGIGSAGKFTGQGVDELAPDGKTCTVPGGVANAGTESTLVSDVGVSRFTETGIFCFSNQPPARSVPISPRYQRPLSRPSSPRQGLLLVARENIPERLEPSQLRLKERSCPSMRRGRACLAGSRILL